MQHALAIMQVKEKQIFVVPGFVAERFDALAIQSYIQLFFIKAKPRSQAHQTRRQQTAHQEGEHQLHHVFSDATHVSTTSLIESTLPIFTARASIGKASPFEPFGFRQTP